MAMSSLMLGCCFLLLASAQFYLPTSNSQKYVRPRLDRGKADRKRDPASAADLSRHPSADPGQDHARLGQMETMRQLLAAHGNLRIPDGHSAETKHNGYREYESKKHRLLCYLLLQLFDEKIEQILAGEEGENKGSEQERQLSKQRADDALVFFNRNFATLDYCSQYFSHD